MKFSPGLRAFNIIFLFGLSILYTLGAVFGFLSLNVHYLWLLSGVVIILTLSVLQIVSIKLLVLRKKRLVNGTLNDVLKTMQIDYTVDNGKIRLDRSGLEIKVISVGFISLVALGGGTKKSKAYLASVIKKFINYRHN